MSRRKIPAVEWTCSAQRGRRVGRVCFLCARFLFTSKERWLAPPLGARKLLLLLVLLEQQQGQELSLPFGERVTFLCLCKEKLTKRKHTLPPRPRRYATRVHSAGRIFRRDIPVPSKNDAHPCASPHAGSCLPAPSLRKEPGTATAKAKATAPLPGPPLAFGKGRGRSNRNCKKLPSPLPLSRKTGEGMPITIADPTRSTAAYIHCCLYPLHYCLYPLHCAYIHSTAAYIQPAAAAFHSTAEAHP